MKDPPVFLIGTHRSGTTWLGSLLGKAPGFAYWVEPRQVWTYKNWHKPDDVLTAEDATDKIKRHIRTRFSKYTDLQGASRFCEKTPSNCLRIPFIYEVFPEGKFILLIRDGRAVYRSTDEIQSKGANWNRIRERIRESSIKELPAYFDRVHWVWQKLTNKRLDYWGVRPPGWKGWLQNYSPAQIIALQWATSILVASDRLSDLPEASHITIKYEQLVEDPARQLDKICDFVGIENREVFIERGVESVRPDCQTKWKTELSEDLLEEIKPIILPTLTTLGYDW